MDCNTIAAILDEHLEPRLTPAERRAVDEHLLACPDCSAAWHAQAELRALPTPPVPAALLERVALVPRIADDAGAKKSRMPIVVGAVLIAGAALAAGITAVSLSRSSAAPTTRAAVAEGPIAQPATENEPNERLAGDRSDDGPEPPTSVDLVEVALGMQPIVRKAPDYPADALRAGLEGQVQLEFDVTAAGLVANVGVIESSDSVFEESAVRAVSEWRYLPRIVAGKRVGSNDVRTLIRFALAKDEGPQKPLSDEAAQAAARDWAAFNADLEVAVERLVADDLRGVELKLDEMQALYGAGRADLWSFYGYLYTVLGNYGRAIDAYERSVAIYVESPSPSSGPWVPLANLYFARHQYDIALETLLRPTRAMTAGGTANVTRRLGPEGEALIERLRALGVNEDSLSRRR